MITDTSIYQYAKQNQSTKIRRIALRYYGNAVSFGDLFLNIDNFADHLYALGVGQGTVVTLHLPNCPQAVIALYAVAKLGGICNMVHALTPPDALRDNLRLTRSSLLITHREDCARLDDRALLVDLSHYMGAVTKTLYRAKTGKIHSDAMRFEELLRPCAEKARIPVQDSLANECAVYLHSSGSTGKPKTILLSHSALNNCVDNTEEFFEHGDMQLQVSLGVLPSFHGFGLAMDVHRNVTFGSCLVMLLRWNAKTAVKLIKKHGVTLMVGVPTMYHALLQEPGFRGKRIRQLSQCYVGGDNVAPSLAEAFDARVGRNHCLLPGFGLTEATTCNCVNTFAHYKPGSAGYPVRNTTIAVDVEGEGLRSTGTGELVISSKTLMMGYLHDPAATEATLFEQDGRRWVRTGDCVQIDEEGFLFFKNRVKDIIIHNGYNVYPIQVEDVIRRVPGVAAVCVVGVPDPILHTQDVKAVLVLEEQAQPQLVQAAVKEECLRLLPRYACPKRIVITDDLPRNAMGKIDRKGLVDL